MKNLYVQYVDMFTKERLHQLNVQSVTHQLLSSKSSQPIEHGLLSM